MQKQLFIAVCTTVLFGCSSATEADDVSGVYIRHTSDETGSLWDTLDISPVDVNENLYSVVKKSSTQYVRDGKDTLPVEHKSEKLTGKFNRDDRTFSITELGAEYTVDKIEKTIGNAQVNFKKID